MELRIAAILGLISASLQLIMHLLYFVLGLAQRNGGFSPSWVYPTMQGCGLVPSIGWVACFVFFLIGFNKLLRPVGSERGV
jgi:hypothetical protein